MKQSKLINNSKKDVPEEIESKSARLFYRADYIDKLASGIYSFLPLGWRVHEKIANIIREEMRRIGAQEVLLPTLQPKKLWEKSGRWGQMDPPLFKVEDRHERKYALGSTHEEVVGDLIKERINSYRDLPAALFQIQNKFRNEMRATGGLLRTREFMMKDLYSFHEDEEDLEQYYSKVEDTYDKIYSRCGVEAVEVEALSGSIGGNDSDEFMILASSGEDDVLICESCGYGRNMEVDDEEKKCPECGDELAQKSAIEAGHIFKLGDKYSKKLDANYTDKEGNQHPVIMGCYGIGVSRLMAAVAELLSDEKGLVWPREIAPFDVHLLKLDRDGSKEVTDQARRVRLRLEEEGFEVLFDDRDTSAGEKFAEADLIGIPLRIVISENTVSKDKVEVKRRGGNEEKLVSLDKAVKYLNIQISKYPNF